MGMGRPPKPIADRIKESIEVDEGGCWVWQKSKLYGYGQIMIGSWSDNSRRTVRVHRLSYETFVGPIPEGLQLDHLCMNRACCNPEHLEPVTAQMNSLRRSASATGKVLCTKGHRQTAATIGRVNGREVCLPCTGRPGVLR